MNEWWKQRNYARIGYCVTEYVKKSSMDAMEVLCIIQSLASSSCLYAVVNEFGCLYIPEFLSSFHLGRNPCGLRNDGKF